MISLKCLLEKHLVGTTDEYIKANRKASREEEIAAHGHPIPHNKIWKNKKTYCRKEKFRKKYI